MNTNIIQTLNLVSIFDKIEHVFELDFNIKQVLLIMAIILKEK